VLERMVVHLRAGNSLFVFPEGSRSFERKLRRFRRGAVEAAIRAEVPIVPMFISVNPPMLMKHQPWHEVPRKGGKYTVEFFPIIHTAGQNLDPREVNRQLRQLYEARHARMMQERDAESPPALAAARAPTTTP
jgi:1-acyl-sn-glycerol-3-phosphate acyltransferase